MDSKKKPSLLDLARASENRIKNSVDPAPENVEINNEKEIAAEKNKAISTKNTFNFHEKYFATNNDYGVGDLNMKIPVSIHKKFKLIAVHTGIPMAKIVSNILNQFLVDYEKEIDQILKG